MSGATPVSPASQWSWRRMAPGVVTILNYQRGWLRGDLLAGLAVAAYLVPQVMAYAQVAGLPAIVGLWACLAPLLVYALLGTSRYLSAGPESTTALMTAAGVAAVSSHLGVSYAGVASALALAVGVLCLLGWLGQLGFLSALISRPVLVGYMAGIALLMILSQLGKTTRVEVSGDTIIDEVRSFFSNLENLHWPTFVIAVTALVLLLLFQRFLPSVPGPLVVMVLAAVVVGVAGLQEHGVAVIGEVPRGLPDIELPPLSKLDLVELGMAAVGLAIVAYSDNVLTARAFADRRRQRIDANQEFLALGTANIATSFLQGFPISSSGSRTSLADRAGAKSQVYSLVTLLIVIATLLFLGPLLETFPMAVLGAVVIYAALRLIDVAEMRRFAKFRPIELAVTIATALAVVLLGVLPGIGVAVGLSILDVLRKITRPHDAIQGYVPGVAGMHDIDDYRDAEQVPGLVIYRYDAPMIFTNSEDFRTRALAAFETGQHQPHWMVLNMEANTHLDITAADALEEVRSTVVAAGAQFGVVRVKHELRRSLEQAGLLERIGEDRVFMTLPTAVAAYTEWHQRTYGGYPDDPEDQ